MSVATHWPRRHRVFRNFVARKCLRINGKPKRAFATIEEARRFCTGGLSIYACPQHGFHVGHR